MEGGAGEVAALGAEAHCSPVLAVNDGSKEQLSFDLPDPELRTHNLTNLSPKKGPSSQGLLFPVVMYGCESWTIKKAECQRTDAFELWC